MGKGVTLFADHLSGKPLVISLFHGPQDFSARIRLATLQERLSEFKQIGANVIAVSAAAPDEHAKLASEIGVTFPLLSDPAGEFAASFGLADDAEASFNAVLDCNGRLLKIIESDSNKELADQLLDACRGESLSSATEPIQTQAPVLQIPRVFEPAFCQDLIDYWNLNEKRKNEIARGDDKGFVSVEDENVKRRSDVLVPQDDHPLNQGVARRLSMRLVPEVEKAFQFQTSAYDVARIVCYDEADQGFFAAHRDEYGENKDNPRHFAVSINLNTEYEGGILRFAEYGQQTYKPGLGDACVFSCKLLHEVLPVTQGQRFGVILFLY
jgi:peroxiredoxin/predicted 2-oxoglutarate/Fe(II)-dependent dioxygenase YbiX